MLIASLSLPTVFALFIPATALLLAFSAHASPIIHGLSSASDFDFTTTTHASDNTIIIDTHTTIHRYIRSPRSPPKLRHADTNHPKSPQPHHPTPPLPPLGPRTPAPPRLSLASSLTVKIPELGDVLGTSTLDGRVHRFTLPYAEAPVGERRFKPTTPIAPWRTRINGTRLPPICAQTSAWSYTPSQSEDCLYLNIYTPANTAPGPAGNLPVFVWLHGGSFRAGSTSDPAIDASRLALDGNMVVVTVQYRLGVFGFLRSSLGINGNMALHDVITSLNFIKSHIKHFSGDASTLTLAGQSSGAELIKTLLSTPSADALFNRAILHSAPLNYGDHSINTAEQVGAMLLGALNEKCTDLACLQAVSVQSLLAAQDFTMQAAPQSIPGVAVAAPLRPVIDGVLVKSSFMSALNSERGFSNTKRQLIFTTVKNEAGLTVDTVSQQQIIEPEYFEAYVRALMDESRAERVLASGVYKVDTADLDGGRNKLEELGTDWVWRCPNQHAAVNITARNNAPQVYLAEFDLGAVYADNADIEFCKGRVCHQDDIPAIFSTTTSPTSAQQALSKEITARWSAFARTGSPNAPSYVSWNAIKTTPNGEPQLNMLLFNPDGRSTIVQEQNRQACSVKSGLWGRVVPFDEQLYADL